MDYIKTILLKRIGNYFMNWHPFVAFLVAWCSFMTIILYLAGQIG